MKASLVNLGERRLDHELIWGSIGLVLGLIGWVYPANLIRFVCPFKAFTGLPCPTCGVTRSFLHLRRFEVLEAFAMNPLMAAIGVFAAVFCVYAWITVLLRTRRVRIAVTRRWEPTMIRTVVFIIFFANWLYLIWMQR